MLKMYHFKHSDGGITFIGFDDEKRSLAVNITRMSESATLKNQNTLSFQKLKELRKAASNSDLKKLVISGGANNARLL